MLFSNSFQITANISPWLWHFTDAAALDITISWKHLGLLFKLDLWISFIGDAHSTASTPKFSMHKCASCIEISRDGIVLKCAQVISPFLKKSLELNREHYDKFRAMTIRMKVCSLHRDRRIMFTHGYLSSLLFQQVLKHFGQCFQRLQNLCYY